VTRSRGAALAHPPSHGGGPFVGAPAGGGGPPAGRLRPPRAELWGGYWGIPGQTLSQQQLENAALAAPPRRCLRPGAPSHRPTRSPARPPAALARRRRRRGAPGSWGTLGRMTLPAQRRAAACPPPPLLRPAGERRRAARARARPPPVSTVGRGPRRTTRAPAPAPPRGER